MHISTKCSVALHSLIIIYKYGRIKKITGDIIAASACVNPVTVRKILSALKKHNIISVKSGTGGAEFIADPDEVSLYDICSIIDPDFYQNIIGVHSPAQLCPVGKHINPVLDKTYRKVRDDLSKSLSEIKLREVFDNFKEEQAAQKLGEQL